MKTILSRLLLALTVALGATGMSAARAETICDQGGSSCRAPNYVAVWPAEHGPPGAGLGGGSCPGNTIDSDDFGCLSPQTPPAPVFLSCATFETGLLCEAWPQAEGDLHYGWDVQGWLSLGYQPDPASASIFIDCSFGGDAVVSVTVISPGFATASASVSATCGDEPTPSGLIVWPGGHK